MAIPTAGELVSGFWGGDTLAGPVDAYARIAYLLGRNAAGRGTEAPLRGWVVREDERVTPGVDGRPTYGFPLPPETPAWVAYDLVGGPVLAYGPDFTVADGYVWFEKDPLAAATVVGHVWVDGVVRRTATLFYSPGLATPAPSTPQAGTYAALVAALALACDSPASGPTPETVEAVWAAPDGTAVVTDRAAYRLPPADTPAVAAGATLPPRTPLGSAWRLYRLGLPYPPLTHLAVPPGMCPGATVGGPIAFYNHTVPLFVDTASGRTRVRWALGGTSGDVSAFWAAAHAWGIGAGARTLAQALDTRTEPDTEPTAYDLPGVINPFEYACRHLFNGTGYLVVVDEAKFGPASWSTAARAAAVTGAADPFTVVIEWAGGVQPAPPEVTPT